MKKKKVKLKQSEIELIKTSLLNNKRFMLIYLNGGNHTNINVGNIKEDDVSKLDKILKKLDKD